MEALQRQAQGLVTALEENRAALASLKDFPSGKDALIFPLGSGVHARGRLQDTEKVLVEIGAGVVVEKTVADATVFLQERRKKLEAASQRIQKGLTDVEAKLAEIDSKAQALQQ